MTNSTLYKLATRIANVTVLSFLAIGAISVLLWGCANVAGPQVQATATAITTVQATATKQDTFDACINLHFTYRTMAVQDVHFRDYLNAMYCVSNGAVTYHSLDQRTGDRIMISTQVNHGLFTVQISYATGNLVYASSSVSTFNGHKAIIASNQWHEREQHEYDLAVTVL